MINHVYPVLPGSWHVSPGRARTPFVAAGRLRRVGLGILVAGLTLGLIACLTDTTARAGDAVIIPKVTQGYGEPPPPPVVHGLPDYRHPGGNAPGRDHNPPNEPTYGENPNAPAYPPSQPGGVVIPRVTEGYGAPPAGPSSGPGSGPGIGHGTAFDPGKVFGPGTARQPLPRVETQPAPPAGPHVSAPYQVSGVTIIDINTGRTLPIHTVDLRPTIERIQRGEKNVHRNDGTVYRNNNRQLPREHSGYYHEYVVPTPGVHGPGPQRLILGQRGEVYYTPDHYDTFVHVQ